MILVRTGPRFLFFTAKNKEKLFARLEKEFNTTKNTLENSFEKSGEGDTILFIVQDEREKEQITVSTPVLLVRRGSSPVLLSVINNRSLQGEVIKANLGPGLLVMKTPPPADKIMEKVKAEYKALPVSLLESIKTGKSNWSALCFTSGPLSRPISTCGILETTLLIKKDVPDVYQELRRQAVKYLTEELEEGQWRECKINIYDYEGRYNLHYQRVTTVIEDLEMGFILGETWSIDHPFVLMAVPVFQVRLFTYLDPLEVKKIMMALEYDAEGNRIVDLDLYDRKNKFEWGGIVKNKKDSREKIALTFREKYYKTFSSAAASKLRRLEQSLLEGEE